MNPTYDDICFDFFSQVRFEAGTAEFKFDIYLLVAAITNVASSLAIRITLSHQLHSETQFFRQHTKKENNALFVYGSVKQSAKIDRFTDNISVLLFAHVAVKWLCKE